MSNKCFVCNKPLGPNPKLVDTRDDQRVFVGADCYQHVIAAGEAGYQPLRGGPKLYEYDLLAEFYYNTKYLLRELEQDPNFPSYTAADGPWSNIRSLIGALNEYEKRRMS